MSTCWVRYLLGRLCANQKILLLAIDDTTRKKTGRKADGARVCRDTVRSTNTEKRYNKETGRRAK
ncbi:MAG: hypothetical protein FWG74_05770 [Planctomycetes bacterium]|nr:hypothetical protein [Planctomycetota bacterium]